MIWIKISLDQVDAIRADAAAANSDLHWWQDYLQDRYDCQVASGHQSQSIGLGLNHYQYYLGIADPRQATLFRLRYL